MIIMEIYFCFFHFTCILGTFHSRFHQFDAMTAMLFESISLRFTFVRGNGCIVDVNLFALRQQEQRLISHSLLKCKSQII